jgi:hypothetical protein
LETWVDDVEAQPGEEMSAVAYNENYYPPEASWTLWETATGIFQRQDGDGKLKWTWGVRNRKTG